ncbi:MAG: hypothetical protein QOD00_3103, partial [Blastocatellia bacterium]|nr:hypothetical protein [Blastocatellia bacterium]
DFTLVRIALGLLREQASDDMITALATLDERYVERIVRSAVASAQRADDYSNIECLTPAMSGWLLRRLRRLKTDAPRWIDHLRVMQRCASARVDLGARLDLIRLALGAFESDELLLGGFLQESSSSSAQAYGDEFLRSLALGGVDSQEMIQRLIQYLDSKGCESREAVDNEMRLIGKIIPKVNANHLKNLLITHLKSSLGRYPSLAAHETFAQEIKEHLFKWDKDRQLLEILHTAFDAAVLANAPVEEVAALYLQMWDLESSPSLEERAKTAFSEAGYLDDPDKIERFLEALSKALEARTTSADDAWKQTRALERHLLRINSEAMRQHRDRYADELIPVLEEASETLTLIGEGLNGEHLQIIRRLLEEMRESIPGQRFLNRIRRK